MESKRIEFIDYLNIFCCLSVIALHCNGCFWNFSYERYWITSVFIECIFYFAVPVFFMISGYYVCNNPPEKIKAKRIQETAEDFEEDDEVVIEPEVIDDETEE